MNAIIGVIKYVCRDGSSGGAGSSPLRLLDSWSPLYEFLPWMHLEERLKLSGG